MKSFNSKYSLVELIQLHRFMTRAALILFLLSSFHAFSQTNEELNAAAKTEFENKDYGKSLQLFQMACEGNSPFGCYSVAYFYLKGIEVKEDQMVAKDYYEKACDGDIYLGCEILGRITISIDKDKNKLEKAIGYFSKACDAGVSSSCELVTIAENEYFFTSAQTGCTNGVIDSCVELHKYYEEKGDKLRTFMIGQQLCALGEKNICGAPVDHEGFRLFKEFVDEQKRSADEQISESQREIAKIDSQLQEIEVRRSEIANRQDEISRRLKEINAEAQAISMETDEMEAIRKKLNDIGEKRRNIIVTIGEDNINSARAFDAIDELDAEQDHLLMKFGKIIGN